VSLPRADVGLRCRDKAAPLFSVKELIHLGYLPESAGATLVEIRRYNPLLFDFVLKRSLKIDGKRLSPVAFESRRVFQNGR
jgi:hypothetical protein